MGIQLNSSAPSAQFDNPGDSVAGTILDLEEIPQTDMETGEPQYWDAAKTRPKTMIACKLSAPGHRDADEAGEVTVYISGGRWSAVKAVTRTLDEGAWLQLTYTGLSDQAPKTRGHNRAKRFAAEYRPAPPASATLDEAPPF